MTTSRTTPSPEALYFFHPDGHVPAFALATEFAGADGRLATLPDVLSARMASPEGGAAWNRYFTTLTAEYFGRAPDGTLTLAVMHGVGPLSTNEGIVLAYSRKDRDGRRMPGHVTQAVFESVLRGDQGPVAVVPMRSLEAVREAFSGGARGEAELLCDPVVAARLGADAARYLRVHSTVSANLHEAEDRGASDRGTNVLSMDGSSTASYGYDMPEDGTAWANLLSVGALSTVISMGANGAKHIQSDVAVHDWSDGTRYLAIPRDASLGRLRACPDHGDLLAKPEGRGLLLAPREEAPPREPREVVVLSGEGVGRTFAALEPRVEACMSGDVDLPLVAVEDLGAGGTLTVKSYGYHGFARFAASDVEAILPEGVNGYRVDSCEYDSKSDSHSFELRFLKVEYGEGRYLRPNEYLRDYALVARAMLIGSAHD